MKKILCVGIAAFLVMAMCAPVMAEEDAVDALLAQLSAILDAREQIYEAQDGVYDAVAVFCEQNDYPSLLNARIVCDEASRTLADIPLPELTLSEETIFELMQMGVETDAIEAELWNMTASAEGENAGVMYEAFLYADVYQLSQVKTLAGSLANSEQLLALNAQYDCNLINYLLIPVAEDPAVMEFWNGAAARWPLIGSAQGAWESDQSLLVERTAALLEAYAEAVNEASRLLGQNEYAFDRFAANLSQADMEALIADTNVISGMPVMLPSPSDWLEPETTALYPSYGEERTSGMPSMLIMRSPDVDLSAFNAYVDELTSIGASPYETEGSDADGWQVALAAADQVLLLQWHPDRTVLVGYDPQALSLETYLYIRCTQ